MQGNLLIFGGGPLQLSIILRAKAMGYRAVVIDPDINAPAKDLADVFIPVAGNDFETTLQIAKNYAVKGIVTAATDKPILMMCRIASALNLPFPSYESCEIVLDKGKFKAFLKENNLPHARGGVFTNDAEIKVNSFTYPVIVKPVMNSGSRGVLLCEKEDKLLETINDTLKYSENGRFVIEEYIKGEEISAEALVQNNEVYIFQITDKIVSPPPYNVEMGHIQPSKYAYLKNQICEILQKVVNKCGLNDCALHPEMKIHEEKITLIEIGPRLGGDFITSHLVPLSTGINIEDQLTNVAIGMPFVAKQESKASLVSYLSFPIGNKVVKLISEKELKKLFPEIQYFSTTLNVDDTIEKITNSLNRYGQFILVGENVNTLILQKEEINKFLQKQMFNI